MCKFVLEVEEKGADVEASEHDSEDADGVRALGMLEEDLFDWLVQDKVRVEEVETTPKGFAMGNCHLELVTKILGQEGVVLIFWTHKSVWSTLLGDRGFRHVIK